MFQEEGIPYTEEHSTLCCATETRDALINSQCEAEKVE